MQNIDPVFILQPVIVIILCVVLLAIWYAVKHVRGGSGDKTELAKS